MLGTGNTRTILEVLLPAAVPSIIGVARLGRARLAVRWSVPN